MLEECRAEEISRRAYQKNDHIQGMSYVVVCTIKSSSAGNQILRNLQILHGKQTLALVRKNVKLQPISPTLGFHSHCSVILPKEKDDVETQFDQSQVNQLPLLTNCKSNPTTNPIIFSNRFICMNSIMTKRRPNDPDIVYRMLLSLGLTLLTVLKRIFQLQFIPHLLVSQ
jgi:hypothetical protein